MQSIEPTVLVCLPFAGAGASFFRKWQPLAADGLRIAAVQLPGREERFLDETHTDASSAMDEAWAWLEPQLDGAERIVVFGHSLGAVLAYELAHRIGDLGGLPVERLVVSGSAGPWKPRARRATGLSDEQFLTRVQGFAGYTHQAMQDEEMLELLVPLLRADVEMHENYRPSYQDPLNAPITALRGADDDLVSAMECAQWVEATTGGFVSTELPGGHMYLTESAGDVLRIVTEALLEGPVTAR
ncbi:Linear gramicidin dehydrogenase LgrE [Streptomyces lavendulae subsp. lavendulae]|uniref:Linear gramicidin dehydrogenase LgrE n=1 Tax=Streptomyces lavendulae subsp. lavendulae TaxID=58340 RepID=A0A2K8PS12_STRLA|nr:alpha/beta fold hydrolase [Streptomyces lavendulae]ATZ22045.1 Linear gramicidin dehydrogenase LgrE [Streptomyces lavendulae subsp. lavendulae]ATZ29526.1 Linear gramicidin dehydrogenase LgrE [Streptomyces lavendulae subsp. lavendulae]